MQDDRSSPSSSYDVPSILPPSLLSSSSLKGSFSNESMQSTLQSKILHSVDSWSINFISKLDMHVKALFNLPQSATVPLRIIAHKYVLNDKIFSNRNGQWICQTKKNRQINHVPWMMDNTQAKIDHWSDQGQESHQWNEGPARAIAQVTTVRLVIATAVTTAKTTRLWRLTLCSGVHLNHKARSTTWCSRQVNWMYPFN